MPCPLRLPSFCGQGSLTIYLEIKVKRACPRPSMLAKHMSVVVPNTIPKNAFSFQYAMQSCMLYGKRHYLLLLASMCTLPRKQS